MTAHLRDAAYHLADDPTASETWDEVTLDLLTELGHALSDALDLLCSPGMTAHLRDAAYHLADDPAASETWDGAALDLLAELGDALSDALEMVRVREG